MLLRLAVCCTASHLATYALCSVLHCRVLLTHACRLQRLTLHSLLSPPTIPAAAHLSSDLTTSAVCCTAGCSLLTLVAFSGLQLPATPSPTPLPLSHSVITFSDSHSLLSSSMVPAAARLSSDFTTSAVCCTAGRLSGDTGAFQCIALEGVPPSLPVIFRDQEQSSPSATPPLHPHSLQGPRLR